MARKMAVNKRMPVAPAARLALVASLLGAAAGCGSARAVQPVVGPIPLGPEAEAGQILFMRHCHACHPHGAAGVGPALNNKPLPAPVIRLQIREGVAGIAMPPFPPEELSDEEVDEIIAYLMAIRQI